MFLSLLKKKSSGIPQMIEKIWNAQQPFITAELRFNNILFTNFKVLLYSHSHFLQWLAILVTHLRMSLLQGPLLLWSVFSEPMLCQWRLLKPVPQIILCQRCNYCTTVTIVPSMIWVVRCTEDDVTVWQNAFLLLKQFKPAKNYLSKTKCHVCVMAVADNSCQRNECIVARYT